MSISTAKHAYNFSPYVFRDSKFAFDTTALVQWSNGPLKPEHKELMLCCCIANTQRNFQEPTLQFLKVNGRSKILGALRECHYVSHLVILAQYKIITGKLPTCEQDLVNVGISKSFYMGWSFKGDAIKKILPQYDEIMAILKQVSVYEWFSCYLHRHPIHELIAQINNGLEPINKSITKTQLVVMTPYTLDITDHDSFLDKLVNMNERPDPRK